MRTICPGEFCRDELELATIIERVLRRGALGHSRYLEKEKNRRQHLTGGAYEHGIKAAMLVGA